MILIVGIVVERDMSAITVPTRKEAKDTDDLVMEEDRKADAEVVAADMVVDVEEDTDVPTTRQ